MSNSEMVDLTLAHLRTLAEILRRGSFSRAAEALRLSQPAVSLHVRHLERTLGVPLLERVGKRAFPTEAGRLLLEHAERAAASLDAAVQALARRRGVVAGRVRLGTGATASIHHLPPLFRRLHARHPELELQVVTGNTPDIVARLLANELDLAVVTNPVASRRLAVAPLVNDPLIAVTPATSDWRRRRAFTPAELGRHPLILYERGGAIRGVIDGWFRRAGVTPRVGMELGSAEAIKKLVEAGLGLTISPAVAVRAEVRAGALRAIALDPPLERRLAVVWRRDKPESPRARRRAPGPGRAGRAAPGRETTGGGPMIRWRHRLRLDTSGQFPERGQRSGRLAGQGRARATRVILTDKDYEALAADARRYELHDGELSATAAPARSLARSRRDLV